MQARFAMRRELLAACIGSSEVVNLLGLHNRRTPQRRSISTISTPRLRAHRLRLGNTCCNRGQARNEQPGHRLSCMRMTRSGSLPALAS